MKIKKENNKLYISFKYDPTIVNKIKSFSGRVYSPDTKEWILPAIHEEKIREIFNEELNIFEVGEPIELPPVFVEQKLGDIPSDYEFKVQPMEHQIKAIRYGLANKKWVLGDEMGCGKTFESLIISDILSHTKKIKHCLIICGINGLKMNWKNEVQKYTNKQSKILGQRVKKNGKLSSGTTKDKIQDVLNIPNTEEYYLITNIESLRTKEIANSLKRMCDDKEIGIIIVDEAHKCTNSESQQTKGLLDLNSEYKIAMSGTPLLNNPVDLYAILHWLGKEPASIWGFKNKYCVFKQAETKEGRKFKQLVGYKKLDELQLKLANIMLRRKKEDVLDLPEKIFIDEFLEMESDQSKLYYDYAFETAEIIKKEKTLKNALVKLTKLREITSCSSIIDSKCSTAKLDRMEEIVSEAIQNNESVVIFTNWTSVVKEVEKRLKKYKVVSITGEKSLEERHEAEMKFQTGKSKVIVGTVKAIGTGFNLTKGTIEIFIDEPWTMGDKEQATDRCHRIGQKSNVVIYSLFTKDTVDERVHQLLMNKKDLSLALVDNAEILNLIN